MKWQSKQQTDRVLRLKGGKLQLLHSETGKASTYATTSHYPACIVILVNRTCCGRLLVVGALQERAEHPGVKELLQSLDNSFTQPGNKQYLGPCFKSSAQCSCNETACSCSQSHKPANHHNSANYHLLTYHVQSADNVEEFNIGYLLA